jgi:hypothetical protein
MAFYSGKNGSVAVGNTTYKFSDWSLNMDGNLPNVTNFSSSGCRENLDGINEADITLSGPYDAGNMAFARNTVYTLVLTVGSSITFSVPARSKGLNVTQKVEDAGRISATFQSTGTFTAAIT